MSGLPHWVRWTAPPTVIALGAIGGWLWLGRSDAAPDTRDDAAIADAGTIAPPTDEDGEPPDAGPPDAGPIDAGPPTLLSLAPSDPIRCAAPTIEVPARSACERGSPYPHCKWGVPRLPSDTRFFRIWRNTTPDHRWGRPGLVSLILAAAAEHHRRWPQSEVSIGDLDAAGPRHATHRRGQDVDLYLPHAMIARNELGGNYPDNYEDRPADEVRQLRAEVLDFARILATCAQGEVRIYYNDRVVEEAFLAWFEAEGLSSSVGAPMRAHNDLHRFHFHLTVPLDLEPL